MAEYEQLVNLKKAAKPMTRSELQQLAQQQDKVLEILPAKMVHTRKAGSGAFRSRAVVCGNYQAQNESQNNYAGGANGTNGDGNVHPPIFELLSSMLQEGIHRGWLQWKCPMFSSCLVLLQVMKCGLSTLQCMGCSPLQETGASTGIKSSQL